MWAALKPLTEKEAKKVYPGSALRIVAQDIVKL